MTQFVTRALSSRRAFNAWLTVRGLLRKFCLPAKRAPKCRWDASTQLSGMGLRILASWKKSLVNRFRLRLSLLPRQARDKIENYTVISMRERLIPIAYVIFLLVGTQWWWYTCGGQRANKNRIPKVSHRRFPDSSWDFCLTDQKMKKSLAKLKLWSIWQKRVPIRRASPKKIARLKLRQFQHDPPKTGTRLLLRGLPRDLTCSKGQRSTREWSGWGGRVATAASYQSCGGQ